MSYSINRPAVQPAFTPQRVGAGGNTQILEGAYNKLSPPLSQEIAKQAVKDKRQFLKVCDTLSIRTAEESPTDWATEMIINPPPLPEPLPVKRTLPKQTQFPLSWNA